MSGSDGPDNGPSGDYDAEPSDEDCATIRLLRTLEGPALGVADRLTVGEIVNVVLRQVPAEIVAVVNDVDEDAGGVLPTSTLLRCLRRGVPFVGQILTINGGAIQLEVRMRTCETIREFHSVNITVDDFLPTATTGRILAIRLADGSRPQVHILDEDARVIGTVDGSAQLIGCLRKGQEMVAELAGIHERMVQLKVYSAL